MLYLNIRSIRNKIDEVEVLLQQYKPDLLILAETWLYEDEAPHIKFKNYNGAHSARCTKKSPRGASIYVKDCYPFEIVSNECQENNILVLNLNNFYLKIGVIYKKHRSKIKSFLDDLEKIFYENKKIIKIYTSSVEFVTL